MNLINFIFERWREINILLRKELLNKLRLVERLKESLVYTVIDGRATCSSFFLENKFIVRLNNYWDNIDYVFPECYRDKIISYYLPDNGDKCILLDTIATHIGGESKTNKIYLVQSLDNKHVYAILNTGLREYEIS